MKDIKQYFILPVDPESVYLALTNPATIQLWTGAPAIMSTVPGSEFSLWDGDISGTNLEFVPNQKIVQQWDFDGQEDASIVTIKIHPHKSGSSVELRHVNIPDEAYDEMLQGWSEMYFGALEEFYSA
jgi:uncharacterized protein YndB with AHSA1/START domain